MKILSTLVVCLVSFVSACGSDKAAPKHTVADYEKVLKSFNEWSDNLSNPEWWKDVRLTNSKTKEVVKFSELSEYRKYIFYFMSAEKLSQQLKQMNGHWQDEIKNFSVAAKDPKIVDPKLLPPTKEQIIVFCKKLLDVRKATAIRFEALADKVFKKYKDKFTPEEIATITKHIRDFNDKEKLIDRK